MKLSLQNVNKFTDASIEINGITIVGGPNSTGKSSIGKALYCMFNGFFIDEEFYDRMRGNAVRNVLREIVFGDNRFFNEAHDQIARMSEIIRECWQNGDDVDWTELTNYLHDNFPALQQEAVDGLLTTLQSIMQVTDEVLLKAKVHLQFMEEFSGQVGKIGDPSGSVVRLQIKDKMLEVEFDKQLDKTRVNCPFLLINQAVYIDDPFVLNRQYRLEKKRLTANDHRTHLMHLLVKPSANSLIEGILTNDKLKAVFNSLDNICAGELVFDSAAGAFRYKERNSSESVNSGNISAGLQTVLILHRLFSNHAIHENGTLILDEPEIHLHPAWQLVLAECLVLLQKEYGLHILAASHSPYFIRAMEVYAYKHGLKAKLKFYKTSVAEGNFKLEDVTANPNVIYEELSQPLQDLANAQYAD